MRLTAKERILLHLSEFARYADQVEVPPEMGQDGIAKAVGIRVHHVRQFVDPLLRAEFLRERTAHVAGHRRRLKVYELTESGRRNAVRLREKVRGEPIRIRDGEGIRETTIGEVVKETAGRTALAALVRAAIDHEVVDLTALGKAPVGPPSGLVERLTETPRLEAFVGRGEELGALTREGDGPRVFVIQGVAGIGKSSLAAKACERLHGSWNLYWHRIRQWDTRATILAGLGDFLAAVGRPGLRAVLARGEGANADAVLRDDLPGTRSVLVFDDAHEANPEVFGLLRFLKDVISVAPDVRAFILSRRSPPFYDRRDVTIQGLVREVDLAGLAPSEIDDLLKGEPDRAALADVARQLGGHPLFLELLRSAAHRGRSGDSLKDIRRFIEEEIFAQLSDGERRMMKTAALYSVPFPREAVFADPTLSHDALVSLTSRSLIRTVGEDSLGVHDTIRDFFASILTPAERAKLAPLAVDQLLRLADQAEGAKDFVGALNCLSNALELATSSDHKAAIWEALADTHERIGDVSAALKAYGEAVRVADGPDALGRLHRKAATALELRGEMARATAEIDAGFEALGRRPSFERGWLNLVQCRVAWQREQWAEAREHGQAALAVLQATEAAIGQIETLLELANVEIYAPQGNAAEAERLLTQALEVSQVAGDRELEARVHIVLSNLYANRLGNPGLATHHMDMVEARADSITDPHIRRSFLMLRGWFTLYQRADFRKAEDLFTQALALGRRLHAPSTVAFAKSGIAYALYFDGQLVEARRAFEEFAGEIDAQGFPGHAAEALWMVAECCMRLNDLEGFLQIAAEYRDPLRAAGIATRPANALVLEGLERVIRADPVGCEAAFTEAVRLIDTSAWGTKPTLPNPVLGPFVHFFFGVALRAMGRQREAKVHVREAAQVLEANGLRAHRNWVRRAEPEFVEFLRRASALKASSNAA